MSVSSSKLQNDWPMFSLGKLCEINIGRTPSRSRPEYWGSGYPWLSIADMNQGRDLETTKESITDLAVKECNCQLVPVGTVLLSFKLSIGKVGIAHIPLFTNEAIAALLIRDSNKLSSDYLYWALQSIDLTCGLDRAAKGLTLNKAKLVDIEIPVPPLPEQKRIADILDRAEALRTKRRETLDQLDELIQSIFIETFGDPIKNAKKWETLKFSEVGTLQRGKSKHRPRNAPELLGGKYPLIQTGDVANSGGYITEYTQTYSELGLKQSKMWPAGTLCITIAANIAKTGILTFDACFPDSVVGFIPNEKVKIEYVQYWMSFLQKMLEESAPESAQKNINLKILFDLNIPVPPLELQNQFTATVHLVEKIKRSHQQSLLEINNLFDSLMNEAFTGKLFSHQFCEQNIENGVKI